MKESQKGIEPNVTKMTEADLKIVLKTVNKSIADSINRAEKAHKDRLSQIKARYA